MGFEFMLNPNTVCRVCSVYETSVVFNEVHDTENDLIAVTQFGNRSSNKTL